MIIVLDSGPLGLLCNPNATPAAVACNLWLEALVRTHSVVVPEIVDYELRRELLRLAKTRSLEQLDGLSNNLEYLPISTTILRNAAHLWADVRRKGRPTAPNEALDVDVILAAQALSIQTRGHVVVATTNRKHLERFVQAEHWNDIR